MKYNKHYAVLFLNYFNNYLTVEKFAADLNISVSEAKKIIEVGRYSHELDVQKYKSEKAAK